MDKIYNSNDIEYKLYKVWEEKGFFKPHGNKSKEAFCIMIPPPNITGGLHMGHAFQQTIIDIMTRYHRMLGKNTLCQAGFDHAGIATQIVVERKIYTEEGKTRHDYGRDAFIKKILDWKKEFSNLISYQMRRLGISADWERERFTMDKMFTHTVKEAFIRLYRENLIYRSKRLVNWDTKLRTAISDLEVENRELKGSMWYIRYPLEKEEKNLNGENYIVVATTRPETLFGDTAVAVHPEDLRYKHLIGKFAILPLINRRIPIIADKNIDTKKGTGCVKITPAHDFKDYIIGRRHQLPMINILTFDGNIRENAEIFDAQGNNRFDIYSNKIPVSFQSLKFSDARKTIIDSLNILGLLEKIKQHDLIVPYSNRSGVVIEPMLTDQWYIRTNILSRQAIKAVKNRDIQFIPKKYEDIYFSWMQEIQDWCISRQIWWGHRIPAWYDKNGNIYVGHNENEIRKYYGLSDDILLNQDQDVLDTWFSSSLWTFSSLGWPKNNDAMCQFHPTNVIVSGFDIVFFWITRMIMMTMHFVKDKNNNPQVPFKIVYITGLILDEEGKKMSKSKGNVIDPMDVIDGISLPKLLEKRTTNTMQPHLSSLVSKRTKKVFPNGIKAHSADALRFALTSLASTSRDINWDINRLKGYHNFCNKLWNASRFVLINTKNQDCGFKGSEKILSLPDRWILSEFQQTIKSYRKAIDYFRFDIAANILYQFTWNQVCDWYIEFAKFTINHGLKEELCGTRHTLVIVLEALLRLAHPIIPFITENIWKHVRVIVGINANTIVLQKFPEFNKSLIDEKATISMEFIKKFIIAIRNIRSEMNISQKTPLKILLRGVNDPSIFHQNNKFLKFMAYLEDITLLSDNENHPISKTKIVNDIEILIPIRGNLNKFTELKRLEKEISKIEVEIHRIKNKLKNKDFIAYAQQSVVDKEKEKFARFIRLKERLLKQKLTFF